MVYFQFLMIREAFTNGISRRNSNLAKMLDSNFYEADIAYIRAPDEKQEMGTQQAFLVVVSTVQKK